MTDYTDVVRTLRKDQSGHSWLAADAIDQLLFLVQAAESGRESFRLRNEELLKQRNQYHDALIARHGGEPIALIAELDEARSRVAELEKERGMLEERLSSRDAALAHFGEVVCYDARRALQSGACLPEVVPEKVGVVIAERNSLRARVAEMEATVRAHEEVAVDHARLVRDLDRAVFGEGAAKQASLVDLVRPIAAEVATLRARVAELEKQLHG